MISKHVWMKRQSKWHRREWLDQAYQQRETEEETHDRHAVELYGDYPIEQPAAIPAPAESEDAR